MVEDYGEEKLHICGWGKYFFDFVKDEYEVKNYAHSGWSTKSFLTVDHNNLYPGKSCWEVMYEDIKEGNLVIITLGVNDASLVNEMKTRAHNTTGQNSVNVRLDLFGKFS